MIRISSGSWGDKILFYTPCNVVYVGKSHVSDALEHVPAETHGLRLDGETVG